MIFFFGSMLKSYEYFVNSGHIAPALLNLMSVVYRACLVTIEMIKEAYFT